jgi:ABC-2 type transport system permease protein
LKAAPGSIPWLLGHELRLAWYGSALSGGKRRPGIVSIVVWLLAWAAIHAMAFALLHALGKSRMNDVLVGVLAGGVLLVCATFMLSNALKACVLALFERGDLDLLLSSPLPSRSIFAVRLLGVAMSSAALFLFLFAPFAHVALVLGRPGWLAIYPALLALATVIACAAMLLTLALVRLLGARRTRVLAQVLAAVAGALLFLLSQSFNFIFRGDDQAMAHSAQALMQHGLFAPGSPLWLPGRAALGEALPLLGMVVLALAAYMLTVGRTHRFFVRGLQQAAGIGHAATPAGSVRFRFRRSLFDTVVVKEWRLIARDPHLISQVLLQLVYLMPLLFLVLRDTSKPGPAVGAGLTLLCSSLTSGLAWIVISAEDAPDLLRSSPAVERTIRLAKLAAAAMPPLLLVALPLLWLIVRAPLSGLMVAFTVTGAVLGAGLVVLWVGRPAPRSNFKARGKENFLSSMLELFTTLSWGGLSWALVALVSGANGPAIWMLPAAAVALAVALATLLLAWLLRRRPG